MKSLFILILILAVRGPAHANPSDTSAAHADLLRAFELLENQPMTLAKAHALIAAVSLRHELHPGATNAIGGPRSGSRLFQAGATRQRDVNLPWAVVSEGCCRFGLSLCPARFAGIGGTLDGVPGESFAERASA